MSESIQILIAKYPNTAAAEAALKKLQTSERNQGIGLHDAVVVRRSENGKLHIHETEDVTGPRGAAAVGGILGGVLGVIAGPGGIVVGAALGAVVGGASASILDSGIRHERLEEIGSTLQPEHAALVVLTEVGYVSFIETLLAGDDIEIVIEAIGADEAREMGRAHEIALKALKMGDALADGGMASPK